MHICIHVQLPARRGDYPRTWDASESSWLRDRRGGEDLGARRDRRRARDRGERRMQSSTSTGWRGSDRIPLAARPSICPGREPRMRVGDLPRAGVEQLVLARAVRRRDELEAIRERSTPSLVWHGRRLTASSGGCRLRARDAGLSSPSISRSRGVRGGCRGAGIGEPDRDGRVGRSRALAPVLRPRVGARAPDERRRRRHRDEPEAVEDRTAVVRRIDLEVAKPRAADVRP